MNCSRYELFCAYAHKCSILRTIDSPGWVDVITYYEKGMRGVRSMDVVRLHRLKDLVKENAHATFDLKFNLSA